MDHLLIKVEQVLELGLDLLIKLTVQLFKMPIPDLRGCSSEISQRRMSRQSLISENVGAYNVTKVRRQSVHQPNMASQSEIHRLSTSINMRTEYQALNLAKKNETCPCFSSCLALFNVYT